MPNPTCRQYLTAKIAECRRMESKLCESERLRNPPRGTDSGASVAGVVARERIVLEEALRLLTVYQGNQIQVKVT